ncbi:MAG: hypothetical protein QW327_06245 [Candidatus Odinarchaeota archaeon]
MSADLETLAVNLKNLGDSVKIMFEKASSIIPESSEALEFIKLLLNDVEKLGLELKLSVESSSGIKGIFGAKKKYAKTLGEKINKLEANILEGQVKAYSYYTDYLTSFEGVLHEIERDYELVKDESVKRKMNWSSLVNIKLSIENLKSVNSNLSDRILKLKSSKTFNISELVDSTDSILKWRGEIENLKKSLEELQRKLAFRNILLAKIMDIQGSVEKQNVEFFKTIQIDFYGFLEKLTSQVTAERTDDVYLEETLQLLDPINTSFKNIAEIITSLQDAGIPLNIVLEQSDIKNALTLFKIILEKFRIGFKEYIEQEYLFVDKLKLACLELHPVIKSIITYLDKLGEAHKNLRNLILGVISSWLINFKQKGGWDALKKLCIILENFLLNHYPAINECIRNRMRGVNPNTIRGAALFQNCIPSEYLKEQFIYDTILPVILKNEGVDVLMNVLQAYGERGWIKRAEIKNISSEYIDNYLKTTPSIKIVDVNGYEILFSPEILLKKIKNISNESLYNYFNKYVSNSELCKKISEEVFKKLSQQSNT